MSEPETTREITGNDAGIDEAEVGDAGNGADPFGADLMPPRRAMEDEPRSPDVAPDQIRTLVHDGPPQDDDRDITARPTEHPVFRPWGDEDV